MVAALKMVLPASALYDICADVSVHTRTWADDAPPPAVPTMVDNGAFVSLGVMSVSLG